MSDHTEREASADDDQRMLQFWHEWEVADGTRRTILCVETRLELRPGYFGFDPVKLEALMADAINMMRTSASPIDACRIVPAR